MDGLGRYILSVVSAAVISGILTSMVSPKGTVGALIRMMCGLFLAFTVIAPVGNLDYDVLTTFSDAYFEEGVAAASQGEKRTREATAELIKQKTEAYILDKAAELQVEITVEVTVSDSGDPVPEEVIIRGDPAQQEKRLLQEMIATELGIPKEHQRWISQISSRE